MQFWRTYNNKVYPLHNVSRGRMGFSAEDPSYIPDEYLDSGNFVILRTCFGLGDWGIISAFPRKLKEKYPDCKVWIPSKKLLKTMFGDYCLIITLLNCSPAIHVVEKHVWVQAILPLPARKK